MLIGPLMFLIVVPALQTFFLRIGEPESPPAETVEAVPHT
jgi:hypothetical protein